MLLFKNKVFVFVIVFVILILVGYFSIFLIDLILNVRKQNLILSANDTEIRINYIIPNIKNDKNIIKNISNFNSICNEKLNCKSKRIDSNRFNFQIKEKFLNKEININGEVNIKNINTNNLSINLIGTYFISTIRIGKQVLDKFMDKKENVTGKINIYRSKVKGDNNFEIDIVLKSEYFLTIKHHIDNNKVIIENFLKVVFFRNLQIIGATNEDFTL
jgi:hypothetical protein